MVDRGRSVVLFLIALFTFFSYVYWQQGLFQEGVINWGDSGMPHPTSNEAFQAFHYTWQDRNLGNSGAGIGTMWLEGIVTMVLGERAWLAQRVILLSIYPLATLSMFCFLTYILKSKMSGLIASLCSFLYALSFSTVYLFFQLTPTLKACISLPLFTLLFLRVVKSGFKVNRLIIFSMFFAFLAFIYTQTVIQITPLIVTILLGYMVLRRKLKCVVKATTSFIAMILLSLLLSLPNTWDPLILMFIFYFSHLMGNLGSLTSMPMSSFILPRAIEERVTSDFSSYVTYDNVWWYTFFIALVSSLALFILKDEGRRKLALNFIFIASFAIIFWYSGFLGWSLWLYILLPFLLVFETYELSIIITFAGVTLVALVMDEVCEYCPKKDRKQISALQMSQSNKSQSLQIRVRVLITVFFVLTLLAANLSHNFSPYALESRDLLTGGGREWFSKGIISDVYYEVREWLGNHSSSFNYRILWLPLDAFQYDVLNYFFMRTPAYWPQDPAITRLIIDLLMYQTEYLCEVLKPVAVKYVIVNLDANSYGIWKNEGYGSWKHEGEPKFKMWGKTLYIVGDPKIFANYLSQQKDLKLVANTTKFIIYENLNFAPIIQIYNSALLVSPISNTCNSPCIFIGRNMLLNPEFSLGTTDWEIGQEKFPSYQIVKINSACAPFAEYSLRSTRNDKSVNYWYTASQKISIKPDTNYLVSGWAKIINVNSTAVKIVFIDTNGNELGGHTQYPIRSSNMAREWNGSDISGTKDWFQFSGIIHSPEKATECKIILMAGWPLNGSNPAETWFSAVKFQECFFWAPPSNSLLQYAEASKIVKPLPFFTDKLLLPIDSLPIEKHAQNLNFANGVIFFGDTETNLSRALRDENLFFIYGSSPFTTSKLIMSLSVPREDFYNLAVATSNNTEFLIDVDGKVSISEIDSISLDRLYLYETNLFQLTEGEHDISIIFKNATKIESIVISNKAVLRYTSHLSTSFKKINPTYYTVVVNSSTPTIIVFKANYDPEWTAQVDDKELTHLFMKTLYPANVFYADRMRYYEIKLIFKPQETRDIILTIWGLSWLFGLVSLFLTSRLNWFNKMKDILCKIIINLLKDIC